MLILNLFIIPVILVSLYFKIEFSYLISLLCSLACATFIYTGVPLANILFTVIIFNLTPLACRSLNLVSRASLLSLRDKESCARSEGEEISKEASLLRQSNSQLNKEVFQIVELYKMTRDMSAVLEFKEICEILCKKLIEYFHFKKCRLVLMDEEAGPLNVKQVFELRYTRPYVSEGDAETDDSNLIKEALRAQRMAYIEKNSVLLAPLISDSKLLGLLAIEGLSVSDRETFSILANQFSLEFKRVKLYQRIQELAITDGLTGLFLRRHFLKRLQEEMKRSARHHLHLAHLMIDIDHFKRCNDRFGHLVGDVVLKEVARQTKACVREIDLVGRFGGEEFSALLPDTDKVGARGVAERIRASVDNHKFYAYDEKIKVEVSIGVAGFPQDSTRPQALIDKSDQALYRAKESGRNKVCVYKG